MKFLFFLPNLHVAGAERFASRLANELIRRQHTVVFALLENCVCFPLVGEITVRHLRNGCEYPRMLRYLQIPGSVSFLKRILEKQAFDIALFFPVREDMHLILLAIQCLSPGLAQRLLLYEGDIHSKFFKRNPVSKLLWFLRRMAINRAGNLVAVSKGVKRDLRKIGVTSPIELLYQGIDLHNIKGLSDISDVSSEIRSVLNDRRKKILNVGRHVAQKNQRVLIDIFGRLRHRDKYALIFVGDGPELEKNKAYAAEQSYGHQICFIPTTSHVYGIMKKCDVYAHTAMWEAFGNVIIEAMACGLPVIAFDCEGGVKEILEEGRFGFCIPDFDRQIFVENLELLLTDDEAHRFWSGKSVERSRDFSIRESTRRFLNIVTSQNRVKETQQFLPFTAICPVCEGRDFTLSKRISRFLRLEGQFSVFECSHCSLLLRRCLPSASDLPQHVGVLRSGEFAAGTEDVNSRMKKRLFQIERLCAGRRLLDIGCGTGSFITYARSRGWAVLGTEVRRCFLQGRESDLQIRLVDISQEPLQDVPSESFDCVHLNHVFEHCEDPSALLASASKYLAPGGYLFAEVPNEMFSLAGRVKMLLGARYRSETAFFEHRYFWHKATIRRLVGNAGLKMQRIGTPFVGYQLHVLHRAFDFIQSKLSMGSVIEVIAKKNNE